MKRKVVLLSTLCTLLLIALVFKYNQQEETEQSEPITLPTISLESGGDTIVSNFYENGFDFNYSVLPTLSLTSGEDQLIIQLSDEFDNEIQLGEDYYIKSGSFATMKGNTYSLTKDDKNMITLPLHRRTNYSEESGVYYFKSKKGTFVFKVELPLP